MNADLVDDLGRAWYKQFYHPIAHSLHINESQDRISRDILSEMIDRRDIESVLQNLHLNLKDRIAFVFGAGPSLDLDIAGIRDFVIKRRPTILAADGAADALYAADIKPTVLVTDLDSCSMESLRSNSRDGNVFVHAHGDNIEIIRNIVPKLGSSIVGTTQVEPVHYVKNFGGFTDGDRACYVASYFSPSAIVIAGMDFGTREGRHSKNLYDVSINPNREAKMDWGKRSLEFLVTRRPKIRFFNITKSATDVKGATTVSYQKLISEIA